MRFIKSVPMATCALALGLAALGNLLLVYGAEIRYFFGILSAVVLVVFALKLAFDFPHARAELKTPVPLSVLPTSTMALMLLCTYLQPYLGNLATYLWYLVIIVHLGIMLLFFKRFIICFKIDNVFPSWFVVFVGIVTVSVTAPAMGNQVLGQVVFYIGIVLYLIALVLIIYRMTRPIHVLHPLRLTTAIFTAPMSLCLVGYFASFDNHNITLVYTMLVVAVISYLFVTYKMIKTFLLTRFYPTYAAFTFPYVISALAFRLGNNFLIEQGHYFLEPLATISLWFAVALVSYVFVHYLQFFRYVLKFSKE
jgi:exfoliative toxin A/B